MRNRASPNGADVFSPLDVVRGLLIIAKNAR